jgi:mannose-1-phosphate guanylyltransferase
VTEAILLVGGQGSRLRPLTDHTPKPMLDVAGRPCTEHQLAKLKAAGVSRVVLATSYLAEVFQPYFGDGSAFGVELIYAYEDHPLGTGGAIANAARLLADAETVVVINGDILSGHDLAAQLQLHQAKNAEATLHLTRVDDARPFGCVPIDEDGRVEAFMEKDPNPVTDLINAGCYVFARHVVDAIPNDRVVSVERETFPGLLASGARVFGCVDTSYWLDLGTPQAYIQGSCDLVTGKFSSPSHTEQAAEFLILDGANIAESASLSGGTTVGAGVSIGNHSIVERSVLLPKAEIGANVVIRDAIIGASAVVGDGSVILGPGTCVGDGAAIEPASQLPAGTLIASK